MTKQLSTYLFFFLSCVVLSQSVDQGTFNQFILTPEIMVGTMPESNSNFPSRKIQKQMMLSVSWDHRHNKMEWARRLKGPRTGLSFGYTNFGNNSELGNAFTFMPYIEFNTFRSRYLKLLTGLGASYFNKKYDPMANPNNQAVSTDLTWSFRVFMYYYFKQSKNLDWRLAVGYFHHSNGHTRLPNNGYNSFLLSLSADIKNITGQKTRSKIEFDRDLKNSKYDFFSLRSGIGQNVFSLAFNDLQSVYTVSGEYGRVYNNTFKIGVGFYYRYYDIYYNYITNGEFLVRDGNEFEHFRKSPVWNASNLGLSLSGEFLLNHFGVNVQLGFNFHKPGYKLDWRINQGWDNAPVEIPTYWVYGEFDSKFKLKSTISSRLGLRYYLSGTNDNPKNNFFVGIDLNANGGQADFTEISLGYLHKLNF